MNNQGGLANFTNDLALSLLALLRSLFFKSSRNGATQVGEMLDEEGVIISQSFGNVAQRRWCVFDHHDPDVHERKYQASSGMPCCGAPRALARIPHLHRLINAS
jgi:hypothetical protein